MLIINYIQTSHTRYGSTVYVDRINSISTPFAILFGSWYLAFSAI